MTSKTSTASEGRSTLADLVHAADVSVYSGLIGRPEWTHAKTRDHENRAGHRRLMARSQRVNPYAEYVLSGARMAGLETATYIVLAEHPEVVTTGLQACQLQAEHLSFVALDCELRGLTEEVLHEAIRLVHDAGHECVIYTGSWFWKGRLGDPRWAKHMPLWDSLYDGRASLPGHGRIRRLAGADPSRSSTRAPTRRSASALI